MLNPSIGKLLESYDNRYQLVIDVARRARKISARAEEEGTVLTGKPVTIAMDELAVIKSNEN